MAGFFKLRFNTTNEYHRAVMVLLEQIKVAQNKQWQLTSKAAALHWNQVMRDRILAQEEGQ